MTTTPRLRGRAGQQQRQRRLMLTKGLCEDCQAVGRISFATAVDHIIPLSKGGPDTDENTRNLCDEHHRLRTAEQFERKAKAPRLQFDTRGWPIWASRGAP